MVSGKEPEALGGVAQSFSEKFPEASNLFAAMAVFDEAIDHAIHDEAVTNNRRPDGRARDEVRPLFSQAGDLSPIVHGVGLFYRGGTHVLSSLTLGGPKDSQLLEGAEVQERKYFMHHYNFPPFSSGETGRMGGTNRRMIGHGALAERALLATLPSREQFPYTIRLVSESSLQTAPPRWHRLCQYPCLDGWRMPSSTTAGIAVGLMKKHKSQNTKLQTKSKRRKSKIQNTDGYSGAEDEHGDMDFSSGNA